ncbi:carbohydrate ABC transporter permease [Sinomonas terrae]|uniref:Sugar ABC transporter permease n=1 Tax=Sinomonas terrae TaxID=2908838 RepID=A0ABS9U079_9MICC|nr:sugar ABC transporter permease [Sinomonas terrae]MCH6470076.1 sugar ABC transporter permease [Sinomonas terrae]
MTVNQTAPAPSRQRRREANSINPGMISRRRKGSPYPYWFYLPAAAIYTVLFLVPTFASFFFSLTRWTIFNATFIGFGNFVQFFQDPGLSTGLRNTIIYAILTSGLKVVLGMLFGVLLTSKMIARGFLRSVLFFPVLLSSIGVGIMFSVFMDPDKGIINQVLSIVGIQGPSWLADPHWALLSIAFVDVWKGVGLATVIYIAGIVSIPQEFYEAARVDGASPTKCFWNITIPLARPATATVIILSLIGGLRSFDLIWAMTQGGPGFASDVIASVIYKQYEAGFYGLSTAGNVVLFVIITAIVLPLSIFLNRKEVEQ